VLGVGNGAGEGTGVGEQVDASDEGSGSRNGRDGGDGRTMSRYTELRLSKDVSFSKKLERMFGPGNDNHGAGAKPKKVCHLSRYRLCCVH
jgi:hypothetical protein